MSENKLLLAKTTTRKQFGFCVLLVALFLLNLSESVVAIQTNDNDDQAIDFNRDIKPLLSDRCYQCHGPDSGSRKAGFRLDDQQSAFGEADSGLEPIIPGDPDESELLRRILLPTDDIDHMPPKSAHKASLTAEEIEKIRSWIESGAQFDEHWAFVAPERPPVPDDPTHWSANAIDKFLLKRMKEKGLVPSAKASRSKLLRRITLDLTGLPPTIEELENFINDQDENAYEKVVDRLLSSPRYGEHMAKYWLDAVRYGDTHGLHLDNYREVWPYRDWVIESFNKNMTWADFTKRQLAGDMLPNPTNADLIASGYNRMHITTNEGGSIKEEVYVRNVVDRVSTTGVVFMGLSVGCAQCHDHKFDPISAKDFYSMFAFFNNLEGDPMDGNRKDHAPIISVETQEYVDRLAEVNKKREEIQAQIDAPSPEFDTAFAEWKKDWKNKLSSRWTNANILEATTAQGANAEIQSDQRTVLFSGKNPPKDTYELVFETDQTEMTGVKLDVLLGPNGLAGRASNGNAVLSEIKVDVKPKGDQGEYQSIHLVSADADYSQPNFPVANAIDGVIAGNNGWAVNGHQRKADLIAAFASDKPFGFPDGSIVRVQLIFESPHTEHTFQKIRLATTNDTAWGTHQTGPWHQIGPFVASSRKEAFETAFGPEKNVNLKQPVKQIIAQGKEVDRPWEKKDYSDGKTHLFSDTSVGSTYLYREIFSPGEREITVSLGSDDGIKVWLNQAEVLSKNVARGVAADQESLTLRLQPGKNQLLLKIVNIGGACGFYYAEKDFTTLQPSLAIEKYLLQNEPLTQKQETELRLFYGQSSPILKGLNEQLKSVDAEIAKVRSSQPTTLVMRERMQPKPAYLLKRGEYDQPDKDLGPMPRAVPDFLPPFPEGAPLNRLGFADWLLSDEHPLLARVTVNRFWHQFMGAGIVTTADDFGSQGMPPTHPELLDWLAVEFRESGWNTKGLVKMIVMSNAYQQDSAITPEKLKADPKNQWLSRGPRYRLDAEILRDQALAVSGLLHHQLGGPAVKPPQPSGLWKAVGYSSSNTANFRADQGHEKVHRRSIYTFWKRTAPPPQMAVLDAPSREDCVVIRERTNNPLQALLMLNDPQYFEAARHLAERTLKEQADGTVEDRATWMFYLATTRKPKQKELEIITQVFEQELDVFQKDLESAKKLLSVGAFPPPENVDYGELAAWTTVANVVLNLDEIINKQ